jgi:hypothetical protein
MHNITAVVGNQNPASLNLARSLASTPIVEKKQDNAESFANVASKFPTTAEIDSFNTLLNGIKTGVLPKRSQIFR